MGKVLTDLWTVYPGNSVSYSYKLYKEQENSTLCAVIYYAMLLFGPEEMPFHCRNSDLWDRDKQA